MARGACNKAPTCKRGEDGGGGKGGEVVESEKVFWKGVVVYVREFLSWNISFGHEDEDTYCNLYIEFDVANLFHSQKEWGMKQIYKLFM